MSFHVYELQKRLISTTRWRHVGYFRTKREAQQEQFLPIGFHSDAEWQTIEHQAIFDPNQPEKAILVNAQEVSLGRTAFFI